MQIPKNIMEDIRMIDIWLTKASIAHAEVLTWLEDNGIDTKSKEFDECVDPVWGFIPDKLENYLKNK